MLALTQRCHSTPPNHPPMDIRWGKASMEWYRAMRTRYRGEMTAQDVDDVEARLRELDIQFKRVFEGQCERWMDS